MYVYKADLWCNECGEALRKIIKNEGKIIPVNPADEYTYDSDHYPKGPYSDGDAADMPCHCSAAELCLNVVTLDDGNQVGKPLGTLTKDGVRYVMNSINSPLRRFWIEHHRIRARK
jgi:hypothetical protein